jgi:hypothetical protein
METDLQALAGGAGGAAFTQPATPTCRPECCVPGPADDSGHCGGAGRGAVGVVDDEVIDSEPAGKR